MFKSKNSATMLFASAIALTAFYACKTSNTAVTPAPTLLKSFSVVLDPKFEVPAVANRPETGLANISVLSDNSLKYDIIINNLKTDDQLVAAHIHFGDAVTSGPVILGFNPTFTGGTASGTLTGLRKTLIDTIQNLTVYFNVHSKNSPSGLARGQMEKTISYAVDVALSPSNEPKPVLSVSKGLAFLRLMGDNTLYSKITVSNLESNDTLLYGHFHKGGIGNSGPVVQGLAANAADFGISKNFMLSAANATSLVKDSIYVNVHSKRNPGGIMRGQIR